MTHARPTIRSHHMHTNVYFHFVASLGAKVKTERTSVL